MWESLHIANPAFAPLLIFHNEEVIELINSSDKRIGRTRDIELKFCRHMGEVINDPTSRT